MDRQALLSVLGGLLGGLAGAALVLLVTQKEAALAREAVAELRAEMQARLADVDRSLDGVARASDAGRHGADASGPRVRVLTPGLAPASAASPAPSLNEPVRVDSPAFEAAVLGLIERSDVRQAERAVASGELRRRQEKYWADELSMRLGLTPAQTDRLSTIQAELARDLDRVRREGADGRALPDRQRAARQRAEAQLRAVFTRQQVAAYEALGDELELYPQPDAD